MKQVPEHYLAPVREFLYNKLDNSSDALITGGLVRDLVLGNEPRDTDVLIKTNLTIDEILATISSEVNYSVVEGYGDGHFTGYYKLLLKDMKHGIDYLFINDGLSIEEVIDSFDCSLNKGFICPYIGEIHPPELDEFTYNMSSGSIERFAKFSDMFHNYQKKQPNLFVNSSLALSGETNVN